MDPFIRIHAVTGFYINGGASHLLKTAEISGFNCLPGFKLRPFGSSGHNPGHIMQGSFTNGIFHGHGLQVRERFRISGNLNAGLVGIFSLTAPADGAVIFRISFTADGTGNKKFLKFSFFEILGECARA